MSEQSIGAIDTVERYIVVGTDIYDREADRIARFQNAGVAQLGADWLNSPDATPDDYEWTTAEEMSSDEWLAVHPEVAEAAPAWAMEITASDDAPRVAISYDRTSGAVEIGSAASWLDGDMIQADPGVYVYFTANESRVTADDLRRFAADFSALADALEVTA